MPNRCRPLCAALALTAAVLGSAGVARDALPAGGRKTLLLLPIASGSPGFEWSARALGWALEDGFSSLREFQVVAGPAREAALRELSSGAALPSGEFFAICRRAGADLAVFGGSTLVKGVLDLEVRVFDVAAGKELSGFRGSEKLGRGFDLAAAAVRQVSVAAGLEAVAPVSPRGRTRSLEAYAAYRAALLEPAPAARVGKLRSVLRLDAKYLDAMLRLGAELHGQGALAEAADVLKLAVAVDPAAAEVRNNYGVVLATAGQHDQAQRELEKAVSLAPAYAEARLNLARLLEERGLTAEAERQYDAVLAADAGNDKARAGRAALYDRTGRPELALREFRLLSGRRPEFAEEQFIRAGQEARQDREYDRAEKYFRRATDINPQNATAWAELGTTSYLAGNFLAGAERFRKAIAIAPGEAAYHYYLGLALDKAGQPEEGLREFRRAVELGGPPEAQLGLARAALETGDPAQAAAELERLLAAAPDHAEAKGLLARANAERESRRRLLEGQGQFASQRLARLEQIVADANRANRELEARLQAVTREKQVLEERLRAGGAPTVGVAAPTGSAAAVAVPAERAPTDCGIALDRARQEVRELTLELGREALREGAWERAAGYFERAVGVDPRSAEALGGLVEARYQLDRGRPSPEAGERTGK